MEGEPICQGPGAPAGPLGALGPSQDPPSIAAQSMLTKHPKQNRPMDRRPKEPNHIKCIDGLYQCLASGWTIDKFCPACHG